MNYRQAEQLSEWKNSIYADRFTAWADIQEGICYEEITLTPEMMQEIKSAIETYIIYPAQEAVSEINRMIEEAEPVEEDEEDSETADDNRHIDMDLQDYEREED